ncbi:MAG TPA: hypothetical protein VMG63_12095, partial [Terriglobia bacterium]|nr:hypothetical protein [Terriglobia bacterium]
MGQCPIKSNERQAGAKGSADRRICGLRLFVPDSRRTSRAQFRATLRRYPSSDLRRTQEAVEHVVRVNVESRYRP